MNAVAARIWPPPAFICFLGDELCGLTANHADRRAQWRHWLEHEMAWLDDDAVPVWHTTSNHVAYDETSEQVFRDALPRILRNGPPDQLGLSYFVRHDDLLLVLSTRAACPSVVMVGVETTWLAQTLEEHADARYKLVLGHQAVFPVNGFAGPRMRELDPSNGARLWSILVEHGVLAYLCSHMLCFDVQVHRGVLQILTAGAGTARLSAGEYFHLTQCALDRQGLRYQTVATDGRSWRRCAGPSS